MSVRNNYPLIGTIVNYFKDKRKQKEEEKNDLALVGFIDGQIRFINNVIYEKCASYITDAHIICRTKDGKEYKHDLTYRRGISAVKVPNVDDKFIQDMIMVYINADRVNQFLPKRTRYLYIEFRTSYGEIYYINRPRYDKLLKLKNWNRYMR